MARIVLISCVKKKLDHAAKAREMYISPFFKFSLAYAESLDPDRIYILSAKYGLLKLDDRIEPYELTLNKMPMREVQRWSEKIMSKLEQLVDLEKDEIVFVAGYRYRKYLIPHIRHYDVPLEGLGIGRQLKYMKDHST